MKILIVSVPLEFPLAGYCLASQLAGSPETGKNQIRLLHLDISRLNTYNKKNSEIWRYVAHVDNMNPDIITFSIYLWNVIVVRELISLTKKIYPDVSIIIGGPEVATEKVAEDFFDRGEVAAAVRGAGEAAITEIVEKIGRSQSLRGVSGCSWRNGGSVIHEPPRRINAVMDFPSPYLTGFITENLFDRFDDGGFRKGVYPRAIIETYRGCYMKCSYCQWGNSNGLRSKFSLERVCGELTWVISRNIARLFIIDAMFGYDMQAAKDILRHIIEEKKRCRSITGIVCYHNQDFFDDELFDLYREAGISVELDLQSINDDVLRRIGRHRWSVDNFDRHLQRFREKNVKTTGSADLIIGLPGDSLSSFEESVDFLLRREISIGLYQTSIIPGTRMSELVAQDEIIYSPIAPRSVFKNATFPVQSMISARLIGHGVDFFIKYPCTAKALWHLNSERPVELCRNIGRKIWQKFDLMYGETWQYSSVLNDVQDHIETIVGEICRQPEFAGVMTELFRLEAAMSEMAVNEHGEKHGMAPVLFLDEDNILKEPLLFRRDLTEIVTLKYRVDILFDILKNGGFPDAEMWRLDDDCVMALVYMSDRQTDYQIIDRDITLELLERLNGYFTVEECLDNFVGEIWREKDMSMLWKTLKDLAGAGLLVSGVWARNQRFLELAENRKRL